MKVKYNNIKHMVELIKKHFTPRKGGDSIRVQNDATIIAYAYRSYGKIYEEWQNHDQYWIRNKISTLLFYSNNKMKEVDFIKELENEYLNDVENGSVVEPSVRFNL